MALDHVVDHSFTVANGARPIDEGRPRVAIIVTDGQSNVPAATIVSAGNVHAAQITMVAIGNYRQ